MQCIARAVGNGKTSEPVLVETVVTEGAVEGFDEGVLGRLAGLDVIEMDIAPLGPEVTIPSKGTPVGFDLEAGDWVAPYGKGSVSDFIFSLTGKVPFTKRSQPYDVINSLSFSNKGDGIQSLMLTGNVGSAFRLPRIAPGNGYQPTLSQQLYSINNKVSDGAVSNDQNYFFRVRTVLDESGNVKSALYGKIAGPIRCGANGVVIFTYYLNPTPNDRNMEFDPSKNLFQNLPDLQQVKAP